MESKNTLNEEIKLTDKAAKRIKAILSSESKDGFGLRVKVDGGGCSGMSYNMSFDDKEDEFDKVFYSNGIKVVCDLKSWLYVKGTTVDFSNDMLSGGFKIENPNANRTCGCGTSFSV